MKLNIGGLLRRTVKRGANAARKVGKGTRRVLRRGTNTIGLTKRRKSSGRRSRRR
jgi:hypothetical protein